MAAYLTIVNDVLEKLREDTVSTVSETAYSKLIGQFVNDAKDDMEDINHDWSVYESEITTAILADGTRIYDLTTTNDRSKLLRNSVTNDDRIPAAYDQTTNEVGQLFDAALADLKRTRALTNNITDVEIPKVFAITTDSDGRGFTLTLLWGSNTARTWITYWYIPQNSLLTDGTDDTTEVQLPERPVRLRAIYYALNERGEEMGEPGGIAFERSKNAIAAALETDMQVQKKSDMIDMTNREYLFNSHF